MSPAVSDFGCPRCGHHCDQWDETGGGPARPKAGDLGFCIACAAPLEYNPDMMPRWLTYEEFRTILGELEDDVKTNAVIALIGILTIRPGLVRSVRPTP